MFDLNAKTILFIHSLLTSGPRNRRAPAAEEQTFDQSLSSLQKNLGQHLQHNGSNLSRAGNLGTRGTGGRTRTQAVKIIQ